MMDAGMTGEAVVKAANWSLRLIILRNYAFTASKLGLTGEHFYGLIRVYERWPVFAQPR
jgi:hypothetical protein